MSPKKFEFCIDNISKIIDGKKYQLIGLYPRDDDLIFDMNRLHRKHGFALKVEDLGNQLKFWKRRTR